MEKQENGVEITPICQEVYQNEISRIDNKKYRT